MRVVLMVVALVLGACGNGDVDLEQRAGEPATSTREPSSDRVPPVTVHWDGRSHDLRPFASCYDGLCADGDADFSVAVGSPARIEVTFPVDGWSFGALFRAAGQECGREQQVELARLGPRRWRLDPAGHAGAYEVIVHGRGPGGDVAAAFAWATPADGVIPQPAARVAVLADHDGAVDSYGVELELQHLAATPKQASARVTVTSAEGRSLTFDTGLPTEGCTPEGNVYWEGPTEQGMAATRLGSRPFTYEVEVTLDGRVHRARAIWPADEIDGNEPSVSLRFTPPLPAMT